MPGKRDPATGEEFEPGYAASWHHTAIAAALDDVVEGRCKRLMVLVPPRHGKSELVSIRLPGYYLARNPGRQVIAASYNDDLAHVMSRGAQRVVESEEYAALFPHVGLNIRNVRTSAGAPLRNVDEWEIIDPATGRRYRGSYKCAGVGSGLTGRGFDLGIIDDPIKDRAEADSAVIRERIWRWYTSVFFTRRQGPHAAIALVQTCWHEDDLAGRLLRRMKDGGDQWRVLRLPAVAEVTRDAVDPRKEGDPLWPARFDLKTLDEVRLQDARDWAALYQQRPTLDTGAVFKRDWFRYFTWVPSDTDTLRADGDAEPIEAGALFRFATVDLAASTKTSADFTVMLAWGYDVERGLLYLLDMERGQIDAPTTLKRLRTLFKRWGLVRAYVEAVAYQLAFIQLANNEDLPCEELKRDRDKLARAYAAAPLVEQGRVFWCKSARWLDTMEHELLGFPLGTHDDIVDAVADGCMVVRQGMVGGQAPSGGNIRGRQWSTLNGGPDVDDGRDGDSVERTQRRRPGAGPLGR